MLLLAAGVLFVAMRWERLPDEVRLAVLLGVSIAGLGAGTRLRSTLPATATSVFHLGALLLPVTTVAVAAGQGWGWAATTASAGVVAAASGYGLRAWWPSVVLRTTAAAGVVTACVAVARLAVDNEIPCSPGLLLVGAAAAAWFVGMRAELRTWVLAATFAPPATAAAVHVLTAVDVGAGEGLGLRLAGAVHDATSVGTPPWSPMAVAAAAAVLFGLDAASARRAWLVHAAIACGGMALIAGWGWAHPAGQSAVVAAATVFLLLELAALACGRDELWQRPVACVAGLAEVCALMALPLVASGLADGLTRGDRSTSFAMAAAAWLCTCAWTAAAARRSSSQQPPLAAASEVAAALSGAAALWFLGAPAALTVALAAGVALATGRATVAAPAALLAGPAMVEALDAVGVHGHGAARLVGASSGVALGASLLFAARHAGQASTTSTAPAASRGRWAPAAVLLSPSTQAAWAGVFVGAGISMLLQALGLASPHHATVLDVLLLAATGGLVGAVAAGEKVAIAFAGVAATFLWWARLDVSDVTVAEAWVLPITVWLAGRVWTSFGSDQQMGRSWSTDLPLVLVAGVPAVVERFDQGWAGHAVLAGAIGVAAIIVGAATRRAGGMAAGTALLAVVTVTETLEHTAGVPTWAWLAAGGALLVGAGLVLERRAEGPLETGRRVVGNIRTQWG